MPAAVDGRCSLAAVNMYYGGDVYSSVDPFATALGSADGTVNFIGSDEAALALDPEAENLDGDFLAPGFVHAGLILGPDSPTATALRDRGIAHVHVLGPSSAIRDFVADAPEDLRIVAYPDLAAGTERAWLPAAALAELETLPETSLYLAVASSTELDAVLARLGEHPAHAQRFGYRLLLDFAVPESHVEALGRSGIAITLDPSLDQPLAPLLSAGAQVSLVLAEDSPWAGVRSAVLGTHGIGARAAFNAATRFAHRAAGNPEGGVLGPGAAADFGRWRVERLVVQVADPRVAAWSTDPRSGTPGLPELAADVPLPTRIG